jgi:hypothetical protein
LGREAIEGDFHKEGTVPERCNLVCSPPVEW